MNFIRSIKNAKSFLALAALLVVIACKDESKAPVVTFDSAGKGAYIKLVEKTESLLINILTQSAFDASTFTYSVEFVDGAGGTRVSKYVVSVEYDDVTGANSAGPVELRSFDASSFTTMPSGFLGVGDITITSADVTGAFGLAYADLNPGDEFEITGAVVTTDNGTFSSANTSSTVEGSAFQGFFDFAMPAGCPSALEGTYDYTGSNFWCDGSGAAGTVDIIKTGAGVYSFSDWSFGAYTVCYGGFGSNWGELEFTEVCAEVTFAAGMKDSFGYPWTLDDSIVGNDWVINWTNTYVSSAGPEAGTVAIHFPNGVPFTLN